MGYAWWAVCVCVCACVCVCMCVCVCGVHGEGMHGVGFTAMWPMLGGGGGGKLL